MKTPVIVCCLPNPDSFLDYISTSNIKVQTSIYDTGQTHLFLWKMFQQMGPISPLPPPLKRPSSSAEFTQTPTHTFTQSFSASVSLKIWVFNQKNGSGKRECNGCHSVSVHVDVCASLWDGSCSHLHCWRFRWLDFQRCWLA